ncbi:MAG: extracellular solute-binding protein [Anaerolineaceae bacterium]|nr:extracellular solute-binding protein [Anaerolineaceae bacterium]
MRKRTTITTIIILIFTILLTACQSDQPDTVQPSVTVTSQKTATKTTTPIPTATPTNTPTPEWLVPLTELEEIELEFVHPWTGDLAHTIDELVDNFNQTNEFSIFVKVDAPGSAQQVFQQSEAALRNEKGPDVVIAPIEELAYWHAIENLVLLDEYLNDVTYGLEEKIIEDFIPLFWEQDVLDEHRLGIPVSRNANFLVQNTSWAKELGFNIPPMSPQIFRNHVCTARDELINDNDWRNNGMGGWIVKQDEYTILSWLNTFHLNEFPINQESYAFDQPATLEGFTFLRQIFDEDCSWNARNPTHYEYMINRQALYISADIYDLVYLQKAFALSESEDQWQIIPYPDKNGKPVLLTHGDSIGIMKSDPAQELAAWLFVRWLSGLEQQSEISEINPGLPVSQSIISELSTDRSDQWNQVVSLLDTAKSTPRTADWRVARFVLPDAAFQIYLANITPDQYPQIIAMLDTIIAEISTQPASLSWE